MVDGIFSISYFAFCVGYCKDGLITSSKLNTISGGIICCFLQIFFLLQTLFNILKFIVFQCRALILYVAAGALQETLAALREAQQPDTAAMFVLACREIYAETLAKMKNPDDESESSGESMPVTLPGLNPESEDVIAVTEYYGQYQKKLVHLCMDSQPYSD